MADPAFYADKQEFLKADEQYRLQSAKLEQLNKEYNHVFDGIAGSCSAAGPTERWG